MNNRQLDIANSLIKKSNGVYFKQAQIEEFSDMHNLNEKKALKAKADFYFSQNNYDYFGINSPLIKELSPNDRMTILNYYVKELTGSFDKDWQTRGRVVSKAIQDSPNLIPTDIRPSQQAAFLLRRIQKEIQKIQQAQQTPAAAAPPAAPAAVAPTAKAAPTAATPAAGAKPAAPAAPPAAPAAPPAAAAAAAAAASAPAPAGAKPAASTAPASAAAPAAGAKPAAAPGAGKVVAPTTGPTATPATAAALPAATSAPVKPDAPKSYFFPEGKNVNQFGFYGPFKSPEGKKRYFKVTYSPDSKSFEYTGAYEDK